jgi:dienelactone hydrolase
MRATSRLLFLLPFALCLSELLTAQTQTSESAKRSAFLKLIERPAVDPAPSVRQLPAAGGLAQEHFSFAAGGTDRVNGILVKQAASSGRRPVVIQLHGTNGNKEQLATRLTALANRGFIGVAIDARYHGERRGGSAGLATPYTTAIFSAFQTGREHPFFYDTVLEVIRLIDYLVTRTDVDAARIGLGGLSKGGIETYLAAAVDTRIAAAVPERGVQSFKWALDHSAWDSRAWTIRDALEAAAGEAKTPVTAAFVRKFYDRVAPGIYGEFDAPAMLPLIAPRPLLVLNGDSDPRTPMAGVRESAAAAERAYKAAGAADRFELRVLPNVGHENTPESERAMVEWFVKWLKP